MAARCREHHTDTTVDFTVTMTPAGLKAVQEKGMVAFFKLQSKMSTSNMVLFDASGQIAKYNSPEHILSDFFTIRLDFYDKRRASLLSRAQDQLLRISNKARPLPCAPELTAGLGARLQARARCVRVQVKFILAVVNGELVVSGRKRRDIEADLTAGGYDRMAKTDAAAARRGGGATPSDTEEGEESDPEAAAAAAPGDGKSYDYLLGMSISTLTHEKVRAVTRCCKSATQTGVHGVGGDVVLRCKSGVSAWVLRGGILVRAGASARERARREGGACGAAAAHDARAALERGPRRLRGRVRRVARRRRALARRARGEPAQGQGAQRQEGCAPALLYGWGWTCASLLCPAGVR